MKETVLVTGGAGYIGSHTAVALSERGYRVVIVDDLSNGSPVAVDAIRRLTDTDVAFHEADLTDTGALDRIFATEGISAVLHFAGLKAVGESVALPLRYYQVNLGSTMSLLEAMDRHDVRQLVFSSSATVYGDPETVPISETAPTGATNPYGRSKLIIEDILRDVAASDDRWQFCLLRYFNPVGAHASGDLGEDPAGIPNNLVPFVMQVAVGRRPEVQVFGTDYDTPDGTGVRDYIHVVDLADGHLAALEALEPGCEAFNLGTGTGASVLEVIDATSLVSGREVPYTVVERRPGDIAVSLADPTRANDRLGWRADRSLETMLHDSWKWQSKHPMGFEDYED
ncbi:MAG: UDP-glucose 4-epimerase GalE [Actinomycetia bacterium]|nr:UDP-glucose 4-epimerase GalE [Actinomycetes bacterium]